MFHSPLSAYDTGRKTTASNRQLEADALFKAARLLEECQKTWEMPGKAGRLDEALKYNQRLWSFFQNELSAADHQIPIDLRRDLLQLSAFIDRRTFEVMSSPDPALLKALIEINRHVAAGLTGSPG